MGTSWISTKGQIFEKGGGGVHLEKGGMTPLTNYRNFFSFTDKELEKSRAKTKKLRKRHWITTLWENGPSYNYTLVQLQ